MNKRSFDKSEHYYFWGLIAAGLLILSFGLFAVYLMEEHGHIITGMNNQIVWGMPHVFAIFLIVKQINRMRGTKA